MARAASRSRLNRGPNLSVMQDGLRRKDDALTSSDVVVIRVNRIHSDAGHIIKQSE